MDFSGPCDVMLQMRVFYFSAFWELFPALFIMKSVGSSLKSGGSNCLLMLMANQLRKCIYINSTIIINKATPYAVSQSHAKVLSQKNGKRNSLSQFRAIKRRNGKICETHVLLLRLIFFICVYIPICEIHALFGLKFSTSCILSNLVYDIVDNIWIYPTEVHLESSQYRRIRRP